MNILNSLKASEKKYVEIKSIPNNKTIFYEGDICDRIGIILKGSAVISSCLINGQEVIYKVLKNDDMFGSNLVFAQDCHYKGDLKTTSRTRIAFITRSDLLILFTHNVVFLNHYLRILSENEIETKQKLKLFSFNNAYDRLIFYLKINNGECEYESITSLSKEIGIQRETLSRLISKLVKENAIIKTENTIKINIP